MDDDPGSSGIECQGHELQLSIDWWS